MNVQHEAAMALSSIRRPQPDPQPVKVNTHPGPDFPSKETA